MKNLLIILIVLLAAAGCGNKYNKQDFIGDWAFKNVNEELNYITFTQDSIYTWDEISGDTRRFGFKLSGDSILMLMSINGNERLVDWGKIYKVSKDELIIGDNHYEVSLKRTDETKILR